MVLTYCLYGCVTSQVRYLTVLLNLPSFFWKKKDLKSSSNRLTHPKKKQKKIRRAFNQYPVWKMLTWLDLRMVTQPCRLDPKLSSVQTLVLSAFLNNIVEWSQHLLDFFCSTRTKKKQMILEPLLCGLRVLEITQKWYDC